MVEVIAFNASWGSFGMKFAPNGILNTLLQWAGLIPVYLSVRTTERRESGSSVIE